MNSILLRTSKVLFLSLLLATFSARAFGVELLSDFPTEIHADEKYVFYSHGLIVEGTNPRPRHSEYGVYEFPLIAEKIFEGGDFNLIAHHRPANTDANQYASQLAAWVDRLIANGVSPGNITLIGFSRGAQITLMASSSLQSTGINTVMMGVCFSGDYPHEPPIKLGGHVLSIYETSDAVKSCSEILQRSDEALSTREVSISTGRKHGAFYTPVQDWLGPLKSWLAEH